MLFDNDFMYEARKFLNRGKTHIEILKSELERFKIAIEDIETYVDDPDELHEAQLDTCHIIRDLINNWDDAFLTKNYKEAGTFIRANKTQEENDG